MNAEGVDPNEIGADADFVDDAIDDEADDEAEAHERLRVDRQEFVELDLDSDEAEAKDQLLLDRKELTEAGLELDNPEGFADDSP